MSATNVGRQSPEPERQTGAQQQDAPSSGHGVNDKNSDNKADSEKSLEELSSNPKGPLDDHVKETVAKTVGDKS